MDCPTCFQKIIAPQAPAPGSKFILTGTKLTDKKITVRSLEPGPVVEPPNKFPAGLVIGLILAFMAGVAGVIYWTTIVHPRRVAAIHNESSPSNPLSPAPAPAPVIPPANDAWWTLNPTNTIPETPAAGRIHGQDFLVERAGFSTNGVLTLRPAGKGPLDFGITIHFAGAQVEALAGQTIRVAPAAERAARVQLRWKDNAGEPQRQEFTNGYAMRLEFGVLQNNHLPGQIYLCTPDPEKSYLVGHFQADARRPKPKAAKN